MCASGTQRGQERSMWVSSVCCVMCAVYTCVLLNVRAHPLNMWPHVHVPS